MNHIRASTTTSEILRELGDRLRAYRLRQNITQAELATQAGLGHATVARAEAGDNPTLETIVKMLRALGRLDALDAFLPAPLVSPIQLAARKGHVRQRAGSPRRRRQKRAAPRPQSASRPARRSESRSASGTATPAARTRNAPRRRG